MLLTAMAIGSALGVSAPTLGEALSVTTDGTLLALISLLFFQLRLGAIVRAFGKVRFLSLAWFANFVIVPIIGFALASLFLANQPLLFAGLMIYFLAPCTDWFLGFTRLAQGDTELGAVLIPINLLTQLLLFPVWLWLLTKNTDLVAFEAIPGMFAEWFLLPLIAAQALRLVVSERLSPKIERRLMECVEYLVPLVLSALILQLFAANIGAIIDELRLFALFACVVFLFFVSTFLAGSALSRLAALDYPQQALLAMTMAARNAPLMLALTAVAIPNQPIILAAIVFGMLIEIPHLTALKQIMLRKNAHRRTTPPIEKVV